MAIRAKCCFLVLMLAVITGSLANRDRNVTTTASITTTGIISTTPAKSTISTTSTTTSTTAAPEFHAPGSETTNTGEFQCKFF